MMIYISMYILMSAALATALPANNNRVGYISVHNSGDTLISCSVVYNRNDRRFDDESGFLSKGDTKKIGLPGDNVRDLEVQCSHLKSGRAVKIFRQFVNDDEPVPVKICYDVWSEATNPRWKRVDCTVHNPPPKNSVPTTPFLSSTIPAPISLSAVLNA